QPAKGKFETGRARDFHGTGIEPGSYCRPAFRQLHSPLYRARQPQRQDRQRFCAFESGVTLLFELKSTIRREGTLLALPIFSRIFPGFAYIVWSRKLVFMRTPMNTFLRLSKGVIGAIIVFGVSSRASSQEQDGAAIYKAQCAVCHDNPAQSRAQPQAALKLMSPENILRSLESGRMKDQGSLLSPAQRRTISEYLAGKPLGQEGSAKPAPAATCANA